MRIWLGKIWQRDAFGQKEIMRFKEFQNHQLSLIIIYYVTSPAKSTIHDYVTGAICTHIVDLVGLFTHIHVNIVIVRRNMVIHYLICNCK